MWEVIYDEEVFDENPNMMGILSNGTDVLFYHALTVDENGTEVYFVYDSFREMFVSGNENIKFKWTAENEEKFLCFLNSLPSDAVIHGDDSDLHNFRVEGEK